MNADERRRIQPQEALATEDTEITENANQEKSTLVVAIAEIGDKTQIATVVLAALGVLALSGVSL